jgi:hypothetical protein
MKVPVVNRQEYTLYLEHWKDKFWFHTDIHSWTPDVYRSYIYHLDLMQHLLDKDLYAVVVDDPKLAKFGKIIGFEFLEHRNTVDGNIADIYIRSK